MVLTIVDLLSLSFKTGYLLSYEFQITKHVFRFNIKIPSNIITELEKEEKSGGWKYSIIKDNVFEVY